MKPQSLAQRMFLIAAVALLPAVVIVVSNVITLREIRRTEVHAQALKIAELAALEVDRILNGTEDILRVIAAAPVILRHDQPACVGFLTSVTRSLPHLASIVVIGPDGTVWCMREPSPAPLYLGDRPYFRDAIATPDRVTGIFTTGRLTSRSVLPLALRYLDGEGRVAGVVAAYIDLNWLQSTVEERSQSPGSSLTIADRDGRILARTPDPARFVGTLIPDAFQRLVRAPTPGTEELVSQDGTRRIIGYFPVAAVPKGIYVSAGISADSAYAPVRQLATTGLWISVSGLVAAMLLATYTSRSFIVRPFDRLTRTIDAWRSGDTDARARMAPDQGEIGRVGAALDSFMEELLESRAARQHAENQRNLMVAELNHRVKNMLTLIQAVARQTFAETDAQAAVTVFGDRLRAMAQANNLLFDDRHQAATLRDLVERSVALFEGRNAPRFTLDGPDIPLSGGSALALGMALHELCTNAAKYGALLVPEGRVDIRWSILGTGTFRLVWTERNGPAVTPPARNGFGSKVITQVLEQKIGGKVDLAFAPGGVTCTVTAPLAGLAPINESS